MKQCIKPCHDCPFRKDIIAWQCTESVERNIGLLRNPRMNHACHHTMWDKFGKPNTKLNDLHMCAGFLALRAKEGLQSAEVYGTIKNSECVFDSIEDFRRDAACKDQSERGRIQALKDNQPCRKS
jgi:hypothetical protein